MNLFKPNEHFYLNLAVIGAEVLLLIGICLVLALSLRLVIDRLVQVTALQAYQPQLHACHKISRRTIVFVAVVLTLALLSWNGMLLYRNTDLLAYTHQGITRVPPTFWPQLGLGLVEVIGLVLLARFVLRRVRGMLVNLETRTKKLNQLKTDDEAIARFFGALTSAVTNTAWLAVATLATSLLYLPDVVTEYASLVLRLYLIVALGLVVVKAIAALVDTLDALSLRQAWSEVLLAYYQGIRNLIPLIRRTLEYAVYLSVATLVVLQLDASGRFAVYGPRLIQVLGIFLVGRVVIEVLKLYVDRSMFARDEAVDELELQRKMTLAPLIKSFIAYTVYFVILVFSFWALAINLGPILAGAGIITIVVGLGAQPVINDLVSGFFILLENLFLVGDYIETGTARGVVEAVDIRTTRIRDPNGQQHILRNGQLGAVINYSKKYTFAVVEVGVRHDADLEQVSRLLQEAGAALQMDNVDVLEATQVQGVERFTADGLVIRTVTRVKPGRHQPVARIYRQLVKEKFDQAGLKLIAT